MISSVLEQARRLRERLTPVAAPEAIPAGVASILDEIDQHAADLGAQSWTWQAVVPPELDTEPEPGHWCGGLDALHDVCGDLRAIEDLRNFADLYAADWESTLARRRFPTADDLLQARRHERVAP